MRTLLLLLLCFGSTSVSAQKADTALAHALYHEASTLHENGALKQAEEVYKKSMTIFQEGGFWEDYFMVAYDVCLIDVARGDFDRVIEYAKTSIALCEEKLGSANSGSSDLHNMLGMSYSLKGDFDNSIITFKKGLAIDSAFRGIEDPIVGQDYNNVALAYQKDGQFEVALLWYQKALEHKSTYGAAPESVARAQMNVGVAYQQIGETPLALSYFFKTLEVYEEVYGMESRHTEAIYQNIGRVYRESGQLQQASEYLEKALTIANAIYTTDKYSYLKANTYVALGNVIEAQGNLKRAEELYLEGLSIRKKRLGEANPETLEAKEKLLNVYLQQNRLAEAKRLNDEVFAARIEALGPDHFLLSFSHHYAGQIALKESGDPMPHFRKALNICQKSYGDKHKRVAFFYRMMASVKLDAGQADSAGYFIGLSFKANRKTTGEVLSYLEWYESLLAYNNISFSLYNQSANVDVLRDALLKIEEGEQVFKSARNTFFSEADKITLSEYIHQLFYDGLKMCDLLYVQEADPVYYETAHRFSENSKAALVLLNLNKRKAIKMTGIPQRLVEEERKLVREINRLKSITSSDSSVTNKLFEAKRKYESFLENLKQDYPKYYSAKHDLPTHTIATVKKELISDKETAILEFYSGEKVYINIHSKKGFKLLSTATSGTAMNEMIRSLHTAIKEKDDALYRDKAFALYTTLLVPVEAYFEEEGLQIRKLILVPDGNMGHIPFDVLLTQKTTEDTPYNAYPYLLHDYVLSTNFSLALALEASRKKTTGKKMLIGFAPAFTGEKYMLSYTARDEAERVRGTVQNLPGAAREVKTITNLLSGKQCMSDCATEESFKTQANGYRVLHLATHALIDDENPEYSKLIFSDDSISGEDGLLHIFELYNMKLNADLVTLSACNTGFGTVKKGEGVMSLARGFAYAGCPNLVMSLWPASDQSTAELMQLFYAEVKNEKPLDEALRNAKLAYLDQTKGPGAHPFYWSGFVFIGNPDALAEEQKPKVGSTDFLLLLLASVATFVFAIYLMRRASKLNSNQAA